MDWVKRRSVPFKCPSGKVIQIRRPGPSLLLKGTRAIRIFERGGPEVTKTIEAQLAFLESLPDAELDDIYQFARIMLTDVVADPILSLKPVGDQLSPDDLPSGDFWAIFTIASRGVPDMPVNLKDGETTLDAVSTFPSEHAGSIEPDNNSEGVQQDTGGDRLN